MVNLYLYPSQVTGRILPNPEPEQSSRVLETTANVENRPLTPDTTIATVENNEAKVLMPNPTIEPVENDATTALTPVITTSSSLDIFHQSIFAKQ